MKIKTIIASLVTISILLIASKSKVPTVIQQNLMTSTLIIYVLLSVIYIELRFMGFVINIKREATL